MGEYIVHPDYFDIRSKQRPATPMEALMVADFGEEVEESAVEIEARKQALGPLLDEALDLLTDNERQIVEEHIIAGESLRTLALKIQREDGSYYGKTWIAHMRDEALQKMRTFLEDNDGKQ